MKSGLESSLIYDKCALMDTLANARMSKARQGKPYNPLISFG